MTSSGGHRQWLCPSGPTAVTWDTSELLSEACSALLPGVLCVLAPSPPITSLPIALSGRECWPCLLSRECQLSAPRDQALEDPKHSDQTCCYVDEP
jgi:hypothetical protein